VSLASISLDALELPIQERAALIDQLWESIDSEISREAQAAIENSWAVESEERIDAVKLMKLGTVDGSKTLAELRRIVQR